MSKEAHKKRAEKLAGFLSDPSCKKDSFYYILRHEASKYAKEVGVEVSLRKATILPWISEFLFGIYCQELPLDQEKKLTSKKMIVSHILEYRLPDYCASAKQKHEQQAGARTLNCFIGPVFNGKVPRRGGGFNN